MSSASIRVGFTPEGINESNKAHAVNFLSVAIALIKKDIITEDELESARMIATHSVDQSFAEKREKAEYEIDDSLLFSQRRLIEDMVRDWCGEVNIHCTQFNAITALDSLGLLNRAKVREEFKKSKGTTSRPEQHGQRPQADMDGR